MRILIKFAEGRGRSFDRLRMSGEIIGRFFDRLRMSGTEDLDSSLCSDDRREARILRQAQDERLG